jgi:hypothetical protein
MVLRAVLATAALALAAWGPGAWRWVRGGLHARYYAGAEFDRLVTERKDGTVGFEWTVANLPPGVPSEYFSVRWTGEVDAPETGDYVFTVRSDDGVRLWIDDRLVLDVWQPLEARDRDAAPIPLQAGWHRLRLDYYQGGGDATCRLSWMRPSGAVEEVPRSRLRPD